MVASARHMPYVQFILTNSVDMRMMNRSCATRVLHKRQGDVPRQSE